MRLADWKAGWDLFGAPLRNSVRDLLPIVAVIGVFQAFVFRKPLDDVAGILGGMGLVVAGLTLFVVGLQLGLFPLGEAMAQMFARKGSVPWLIAFALSLGFGSAFAEPALIAIAGKAEEVQGVEGLALSLRVTVGVSVGVALALGVIRILKGWPLHWLVIGGYGVVMVLTPLAPVEMVAIAYDCGPGAATTITVPLTTALGVGLAANIRGRNPLLDGFGMIALATMMPVVFVLGLGIWKG